MRKIKKVEIDAAPEQLEKATGILKAFSSVLDVYALKISNSEALKRSTERVFLL